MTERSATRWRNGNGGSPPAEMRRKQRLNTTADRPSLSVPSVLVARNEAEEHFETYLDLHELGFEYERAAGAAHPDFWINSPQGLVVAEVRHVTARVGEGRGNRFGAFDPYKPLGKAVKRKSRQGREVPENIPYVVVLWAPGWGVDDFTVSGALFGKLEMVMPLNTETGTADMGELHTEFGLNKTMRETERDHISAVVLMRRFNPTLRGAQNEIAAMLDRTGRDDRDAGVRVIFDVHERRRSEGLLDDEARQPRLVTFHNPNATTPLGIDVFNGPFDQQWSAEGDRYRCTHTGAHVGELPD